MSEVLYFAYGSNLDEVQMRTRCARAEPLACAVLSDHALAFGGHSSNWGGAVANVVLRPGARVQGLLYRIDDADLRALDRFEGHPKIYERVLQEVLDPHQRPMRAAVYVLPAHRFAPGAPAVAYLDVLRRAYARLGFDAAALGVA